MRLVSSSTTLVGLLLSGLVLAQSPEVTLTEVGSPIWRPSDFQMFTAPASTQDEFFGVVNTLLPLEGPAAVPYVPHDPPYGAELSTNAAAGGFTSQSVFHRDDILLQPNAVYFSQMFLPDPGSEGSSRDFESGPVIPNSIFPITRNVDVWLDGVLVDSLTGNDGAFNVRPGDAPFDGTSHRAYIQNVYYPWDDDLTAGPLGNYELRHSFRDLQGNGWDVIAPFRVIPEPASHVGLTLGFLVFFGVSRALRFRKRKES